MELRVSTSNITQASDSIVVRAEVPSGKRANSAGKYIITCIASEEMNITGSGELNHTPNTNKRVSWNKVNDSAQNESNLSQKENNTTVENKDENQMELESLKETTSNKLENNEGEVDMEKHKEVEMMDTNNEVVHVYGRVDTPPLSSRSSTSTTSSKGSGITIHNNSNNNKHHYRQSGVELEDIVLEAREGIGNDNRMSRKALRNSVILHSPPHPPSSPPNLPLTIMKQREDLSADRSINEDDTEEQLAMASIYADMEAYVAAEKGHIIEVKEGEIEMQEGVGMGIAKPKQDRLVRKEIVRIIIVALIAVVVVIVFVFT